MKIRYYGHIGERSGYGVAARAMCRALLAGGFDLEIRPIESRVALDALEDDDHDPSLVLAPHLRRPDEIASPDAVIVHTMPGDCTKVISVAIKDEHVDYELPSIAYTTWESCSIAPLGMREELSVFDQVWTPSEQSVHGFVTGWNVRENVPLCGDSPVLVMPHAYDDMIGVPSRSREGVMANQPYRFLYVGAWTSRKNPAGLIRAFAHAEMGTNDVELWIQSTGTPRETFAVALHQTGCVDERLPRIRFWNAPLSARAMREQFQNADCFVTASRGEAWNLPAFEAMLHRCHVIAPAGQGSDTFLRDTSADLVEDGVAGPAAVDVKVLGRLKDADGIQLQTIGAHGMSSRMLWWEPDLYELAGVMRAAADQKKRELAVHYDPAARFSYGAVGDRALRYLEDL